MHLIEYGFSLRDLELLKSYDIREVKQIKAQVEKNRQINRLRDQIEIFQSVYYAMIAFHTKKGNSVMKRWYNTLARKLNKLFGVKCRTVWDRMKKRSNKIG